MANIRSSEVKCKACDGYGEVDVGWHCCIIQPCGNCDGTGKVDWIRRIRPLTYDEDIGEWVPVK